MKQLFLSLKDNKNLQVLKINDNFTKSALNDLIQILPGFTKLKIIYISDSITEEKLEVKNIQKEIFELLKNNKSLKVVQLKGNEINKNLVKIYNKDLTIDKLVCFSDNEEESEEEEKEEKKIDDLTKNIEKIDKINNNYNT